MEAAREGLPDFVADEIEAHELWMDFYLDAFFELDTERRDGRLPIPWTAIDRYGTRYGVEGHDFDIFKSLMRSLDRAVRDRNKDKGGDGDSGGVQQEDGTDSRAGGG